MSAVPLPRVTSLGWSVPNGGDSTEKTVVSRDGGIASHILDGTARSTALASPVLRMRF